MRLPKFIAILQVEVTKSNISNSDANCARGREKERKKDRKKEIKIEREFALPNQLLRKTFVRKQSESLEIF